MRPISELLTILRDHADVDEDGCIYDGLCWEILCLYADYLILGKEHIKLKYYVLENMPVIYLSSFQDDQTISNYGWPSGQWPPRLAWLNEHIELTKNRA